MNLSISRNALLKPLQIINSVVERRQTMPILSNVLMNIENNILFLTGTDLEVEMIGHIPLQDENAMGCTTVSARKLFDICRALPEESQLQFHLENDHLILRSGKSRFLLTTLPAEGFPKTEEAVFSSQFTIQPAKLKQTLSKIHFAMGQQDVRHYLNGALLDIHEGTLKCVATDGHRLALSTLQETAIGNAKAKIILPRKSVLELVKLLDGASEEATIFVGDNHFRVVTPEFTFTSKLINAQYPDYEKLIPRQISNTLITSRETLKQALARAAILSNEKFRGVRLQLNNDSLRIVANNPEQEEAEEHIPLEYKGIEAEIGFNVAYLLDVVSTIMTETIRWSFNDPSSGVLIESNEQNDSLYVVMPMKL